MASPIWWWPTICPNFACQTDGIIGVLLGNGNGTFQTAVTYDSGGLNPYSVAVADVNGDGKPDLLVANEGSNTVGVLLGNRNGTFQTAVTYGSGGLGAVSVAVADVNGDGKPDLLVANEGSNTVGVLLGNRNGTFQTAVTYGSGGLGAVSVAVADVNGDGKPDLLVAMVNCGGSAGCGGSDGMVGVLLNTEATTYITLINLVIEDESNRLEASIMVVTLEGAEIAATKGDAAAANVLLKAFIDEVSAAEFGKLLMPANAAILIQEAQTLMM